MDFVITSIDVRQHNDDNSPLLAFATIIINGCFKVRDLKVIQGTEGLFVAMPSRRCVDAQFRDVAHPINQKVRDYVEDTVLSAYRAQLSASTAGITPLQHQE